MAMHFLLNPAIWERFPVIICSKFVPKQTRINMKYKYEPAIGNYPFLKMYTIAINNYIKFEQLILPAIIVLKNQHIVLNSYPDIITTRPKMLYTTHTNLSIKYLFMCKVYTDVGSIK